MALIVIGGHSRSVGKTSVVAGLIAALRELEWTAVKITQYGHGVCSANGEACDCATGDHSWAITAREFLGRAHAVILHEAPGVSAWHAVSLKPVAERPIFRITPPRYLSPEIVEFVRSKLSPAAPGAGN